MAEFHEWPLVFFTALTTLGAGLGAAALLFRALGWEPSAPSAERLGVVSLLLGLGLLFSLRHLGRPWRGFRAARRFGVSPLSNEVLAVGAALGTSFLTWVLGQGSAAAQPLSLAAELLCLVTLLALGAVYRLRSHLTWDGPVRFGALVGGLALGTAFLLPTLPAGVRSRCELLILVILFLDGLLVWDRTRRTAAALQRGAPAHPEAMRYRVTGFTARLVLGVLLPAAFLLWGRQVLTLLSLSTGLLLDRFLFYALSVRATTESEISRVEVLLRSRLFASPGDPQPASIPVRAREK